MVRRNRKTTVMEPNENNTEISTDSVEYSDQAALYDERLEDGIMGVMGSDDDEVPVETGVDEPTANDPGDESDS